MRPDFYISDDRTTVVASREFTNAGIISQEMNFLFELADVIFSYAPLIDSIVEFSLVCISLCLTRISLWLNPSPGSTLQEFSCNVNKSLGPSLAPKTNYQYRAVNWLGAWAYDRITVLVNCLRLHG